MYENLKLSEERNNGVYRVFAEGDLIISNAKVLQNHIDKAMDDGATNITMDLTGVQYIDSFGIGVVVKTKTEVDKRKGRLLVIVNKTLQRLFEKCHLDDYIDLDISEDEDDSDII